MARRTVHDLVAEARSDVEELDVAQLQAELAEGGCNVIDIRDIRERIGAGIIPGSDSAPRGMLEFWFDPESPYYKARYTFDDRYVFHCASGWRSALAAKVIQELGYTNVAHLEPGFNGWKESGGQVEDIRDSSSWVKRDQT